MQFDKNRFKIRIAKDILAKNLEGKTRPVMDHIDSSKWPKTVLGFSSWIGAIQIIRDTFFYVPKDEKVWDMAVTFLGF